MDTKEPRLGEMYFQIYHLMLYIQQITIELN